MIFHPTAVEGARVVELQRHGDERGFFARAWCGREFAEAGLTGRAVQANLSFSRERGTLRGLHYQVAPHAELKLVRCTRGAIWDVVLDLRPESPSFRAWWGVDLTAENRLALAVPEGCAHGFLSLSDDAEVFYLVSEAYAPEAERGVRWDDPAFGIEWPIEPAVLSDKDRSWPDYAFDEHPLRPGGQGGRR